MLSNVRMDKETFMNFDEEGETGSEVIGSSVVYEDIQWINKNETKAIGCHQSNKNELNIDSANADDARRFETNSTNLYFPFEESAPTKPFPFYGNNNPNKDVFPSNNYLFQTHHHNMCPPLWSLFHLYSTWCSNRTAYLQDFPLNKEKYCKGFDELSSGVYQRIKEVEFINSDPNRRPHIDKFAGHYIAPEHSDPCDKYFIENYNYLKFSNRSNWNNGNHPEIDNRKDQEIKHLEKKNKLKPVNWMLPDEEKDDIQRIVGNNITSDTQTAFNPASIKHTPLKKSGTVESDFNPITKCFLFPRNPFLRHQITPYSPTKPSASFYSNPSLRTEFSNYFPSQTDDNRSSSKDSSKSISTNERAHDEASNRQFIKSTSVKVEPPPRFQCDACQKSYSTFNGLTKHKEFHCSTYVKKQFLCPHCECKSYASLGALKMHIRTHTLPCKCKLCGKAFSRPWLLQGHLRTHTGERPFECNHCSRAFADRSNLRAHLQTHCEVKRYNCQTCKKSFSRMSLLIKHRESQTCNS